MKNNIIIKLFRCMAVSTLALGAAACSEWTETEPVDLQVERPQNQDPAFWAEYTAALRAYKQGDHFLIYARLYNSPTPSTSEQDYMRCLPDSLDIVSLTNADNFSKFDAEDLSVMHEKGTRVLYQVDYAARSEEFSSDAALTAYLDGVIGTVAAHGLDGYSFTGIPNAAIPARAEAAARIVERLSGAKAEGQLLVFEGNPLFVAEADRAKVDYFVLDTETTTDVMTLKLQVAHATTYMGIAPEKLLLAASAGSPLYDENSGESAANSGMAERVVSLGPLAGLAAYDLHNDYYDAERNYPLLSAAIQVLNPSK